MDRYKTQNILSGLERYPGEEMATHSSNLARRISWTEDPGGIQVHGISKSLK